MDICVCNQVTNFGKYIVFNGFSLYPADAGGYRLVTNL